MSEAIDTLRRKAEHCRFLARQVLDSAMKKTLLDVAVDFERDAFKLERKAKFKP